jgi:hypothetical protein
MLVLSALIGVSAACLNIQWDISKVILISCMVILGLFGAFVGWYNSL